MACSAKTLDLLATLLRVGVGGTTSATETTHLHGWKNPVDLWKAPALPAFVMTVLENPADYNSAMINNQETTHTDTSDTESNSLQPVNAQQPSPSLSPPSHEPPQSLQRGRVLRPSTRAQRRYNPTHPSPGRRRRSRTQSTPSPANRPAPPARSYAADTSRILTDAITDAVLSTMRGQRGNGESLDSAQSPLSQRPVLQLSQEWLQRQTSHTERGESGESFFRFLQMPVTIASALEANGQHAHGPQDQAPLDTNRMDIDTDNGSMVDDQGQRAVMMPVFILGFRTPIGQQSPLDQGETAEATTGLRRSGRIRERQQSQQAQREDEDDDEVSRRRWVVYIISGMAPDELSSENPSYEELLALAALMGPARLPTIRQELIDRHVPIQKFDAKVKRTMIGNQEECAVCKDEYKPEVPVRVLTCHHGFHKECIDKWLTEAQNRCPLCRHVPVQA